MSKRKQWYTVRKYQVLIILIIACFATVITLTIIHQKAQQKKAFMASFNSISEINQKLITTYRQFVSLPSTTTKSNSDWDSYYASLITQVQGISNNIPKIYTSNKGLYKFHTDVSNSTSDIINYLNLLKSSIDMQFQVTNDQNKLTSDQSTLTSEQQIYQNAANNGISISYGYVTEFQTAVSNDKQQLSDDQQTQKDQQKQLASVFDTVSQDLVQTSSDTKSVVE